MALAYDTYDETTSSNASQYGGSSSAVSLYGVDIGFDRLKIEESNRHAFGMRPYAM